MPHAAPRAHASPLPVISAGVRTSPVDPNRAYLHAPPSAVLRCALRARASVHPRADAARRPEVNADDPLAGIIDNELRALRVGAHVCGHTHGYELRARVRPPTCTDAAGVDVTVAVRTAEMVAGPLRAGCAPPPPPPPPPPATTTRAVVGVPPGAAATAADGDATPMGPRGAAQAPACAPPALPARAQRHEGT